jgi:hypothetical protein
MTAHLHGRRSLLCVVLVYLFARSGYRAAAQVIPGLKATPNLSAYFTVPANVSPPYRYFGTPAITGYSLGGYLQPPHLVGLEIRGQIQRRLNAEHQESLQVGPRFAMRFGRFVPYVGALGGAGNGWRYLDPPVVGVKPPKPVEGLGGAWTILGGLDIRLARHVSLRAGEIAYSKIYLKDWNLTPLNITAGVVFRIW